VVAESVKELSPMDASHDITPVRCKDICAHARTRTRWPQVHAADTEHCFSRVQMFSRFGVLALFG
jgi:hypothetical protein